MSWYDRTLKAIVSRADDAMKAGAEELATQIRKNISKQSGTPSKPGQYPATQSGALKASVQVTRYRVGNSLRYQVTCSVPYAEHVERIRPFIVRTAKENRIRIYAKMARVALRLR